MFFNNNIDMFYVHIHLCFLFICCFDIYLILSDITVDARVDVIDGPKNIML